MRGIRSSTIFLLSTLMWSLVQLAGGSPVGAASLEHAVPPGAAVPRQAQRPVTASRVSAPCDNLKGIAVVPNSEEDTVSFIRLDDDTECARLDSPGVPTGAAIAPDRTRALVANFLDQSVRFFDLTTDPPTDLGSLGFETAIGSMAITADSQFAVTSGGSDATVDTCSIDIAAQSVVNCLSLPNTGVVLSSQTLALGYYTVVVNDFLANQFRVLRLHPTTGVLTDTGTTVANSAGNGLNVIAVAPAPCTNRAIASNFQTGNVTVLDIDETGTVTVVGGVVTGRRPGSLAIGANNGALEAWVVNHRDRTLAFLNIGDDPRTPDEIETCAVTDSGRRLAIDADLDGVADGAPNAFFGAPGIDFLASTEGVAGDPPLAYVANFTTGGQPIGQLSVFDVATRQDTTVRIPTGRGTAQVALPGLPNIVVDPGAVGGIRDRLRFGRVPVGETAIQTVTISNTGTADLVVSSILLTDDSSAGEFTIIPATPSFRLLAGTVETFEVTYTPLDRGRDTGDVIITNDDPDTPVITLAVSGTGIAPSIDVTPLALDFGEVSVDETATQTVTIRNVGTADLTVDSIDLTDGSSADFAIVAPALPLVVAPGDNATFDVAYMPDTVDETDTGTVLVTSDGFETPEVSVSLTGIGRLGPDIELDQTALDFGQVAVGDSSTETVTISNVGDLPLVVTNITVQDSPEFTVAALTPLTIAPGANASFDVTYTPTSGGPDQGTVLISSNDPDEPEVIVTLQGTGMAARIFGVVTQGGTPVGGVQVTLIRTTLPPAISSTVTAADGSYEFTDLELGQYLVVARLGRRIQNQQVTLATPGQQVEVNLDFPGSTTSPSRFQRDGRRR